MARWPISSVMWSIISMPATIRFSSPASSAPSRVRGGLCCTIGAVMRSWSGSLSVILMLLLAVARSSIRLPERLPLPLRLTAPIVKQRPPPTRLGALDAGDEDRMVTRIEMIDHVALEMGQRAIDQDHATLT